MDILEVIEEEELIVLIASCEDCHIVVEVFTETLVNAIIIDVDKEYRSWGSNILTTAAEFLLPTFEEFLLFEHMIAEFGISLGNVEFLLLETYFVEVTRLA